MDPGPQSPCSGKRGLTPRTNSKTQKQLVGCRARDVYFPSLSFCVHLEMKREEEIDADSLVQKHWPSAAPASPVHKEQSQEVLTALNRDLGTPRGPYALVSLKKASSQ